jgi:hypothetical protein
VLSPEDFLDSRIKVACFKVRLKLKICLEVFMLRSHKLIILIPATLLILILLGMHPLNMAHRLVGGVPFAHGKQVHLANHCPFRSLITHGDPTFVILNLTPLNQESTPAFNIHVLDPDSIHLKITFNSFPLRC